MEIEEKRLISIAHKMAAERLGLTLDGAPLGYFEAKVQKEFIDILFYGPMGGEITIRVTMKEIKKERIS